MIYAVGDIHGRLARLEEALARIERDATGAPVVFLGDLVDRGPQAREVIERLMAGQREGRPWIVIKGNHDRMFSRFVREARVDDDFIVSGRTWLSPRLGGPMTLGSYLGRDMAEETEGLDMLPDMPPDWRERTRALSEEARAAVPKAHLDWIDALPLTHSAQGCLFVHAGIRPGVPLPEQSVEDLLWIRDGFLDDARPHPWLIVHGHTAVDAPEHRGNRVNLDTKAGYGGPVTAAAFGGGEVFVLGAAGRERLAP